eukprot:g21666.t1
MRKSFPVGVPVYLKGVQCAEDALMAVELGLQGVVVSNHGGRACGNSIGALEALQEISAALREAGHLGPNSTFELYFDSGVRCAADVVKALCLGARGVGLGRLYYWAAACHGEEGIVQLVERLTFEVRRCMAQLGCRRLSELGVACLAKSEGGGFSRRLDDYGRPRLGEGGGAHKKLRRSRRKGQLGHPRTTSERRESSARSVYEQRNLVPHAQLELIGLVVMHEQRLVDEAERRAKEEPCGAALRTEAARVSG